MCQKWEGDCGLWVLNEIIKKYVQRVLALCYFWDL